MKNLYSTIFHNIPKYILIALLFIFVLIFAGNFTSENDQNASKIPYINGQLIIPNSINARINTGYRILFDLKVNNGNADSTDKATLNVYANTRSNQKKLLKSLNLYNSRYKKEEVVLWADQDYNDLIFEELDETHTYDVHVDNIDVFPLNINSEVEINKLKNTLIGSTDFDEIIAKNNTKNPEEEFSFNKNNVSIGQIFLAKSSLISGIDLKLLTTGNGGNGNYLIELRKADLKDNKFKISSEPIATYYFASKDLERLKTSTGLYQFPITSSIIENSYYYIGINNSAVKHNILNKIKIIGAKQAEKQDESAVCLYEGGEYSKIGQLFYNIYGAKFKTNDNQKLLTGSIIEDSGNGTGYYSYKSKNNFMDYFDIDFDNLSLGLGVPRYDNEQKSVASTIKQKNEIIYKFDTVYPFEIIRVKLEKPNVYSNVKLQYSFDGNDWHELGLLSNKLFQSRLDQSLSDKNSQNKIFIKASYDENDNSKEAIYFGLNNIEVSASVKIK